MLAEAKAQGFDLPLVSRTLSVFDEASEKGWGKRDGSSLPAYWTQRQA
jgi:3-hydroxyisobutyrate dehydrogenase